MKTENLLISNHGGNHYEVKVPSDAKLILIKKIKRLNRVRKDFGDIPKFASIIEEVGLEQPIVITPKKILIDGERRIKAFLHMGFTSIPYVTLDIDDLLKAEFVANAARKDFTVQEVAIISERIAKRQKKKSTRITPGKTRNLVAEITKYSPRQVQKITDIANAVRKHPKQYAHIMERVDKYKMSVDTAHKIVTQKARNLPKVPVPKGEYDVLYYDPPPAFDNATIRGSAANNYQTMTVEQLKKLKIPASKNAIMFCWWPMSFVVDGTAAIVLMSWGFKPKTGYIWDKLSKGTGSWMDNQHEVLVMAIKGKMPTPAVLYPSVIQEKRPSKQHSRKPVSWYNRIEKMYPKRKYLEGFARSNRPGWKSWGNQID